MECLFPIFLLVGLVLCKLRFTYDGCVELCLEIQHNTSENIYMKEVSQFTLFQKFIFVQKFM